MDGVRHEERTEHMPTRSWHYSVNGQVAACHPIWRWYRHPLEVYGRAFGPPWGCTCTTLESQRIVETEEMLIFRWPNRLFGNEIGPSRLCPLTNPANKTCRLQNGTKWYKCSGTEGVSITLIFTTYPDAFHRSLARMNPLSTSKMENDQLCHFGRLVYAELKALGKLLH